jgi:uncharacterized coiled-coil protein SlyX
LKLAPPPKAGRAPEPVHSKSDKASGNAAKKREREIVRLENEISSREKRVKELELVLADPELYHDAARSKGIVAEYEKMRAELESLWEKLTELG